MQRAAAGALRNVVYQNDENKMEVKEKDGLTTTLATLKGSRDVETRRELTGWSSAFFISRRVSGGGGWIFFLKLPPDFILQGFCGTSHHTTC